MSENTLYYGDNLKVLREHIADNSIDLIYLDPPFNSKATYNVLFREPDGAPSEAQITAFDDSWHWSEEAERTFEDIVRTAPADVVEMMRAFIHFVGRNDMMAYLTMMCIRLVELRRVLKDTGSIYLHCDPTASHYLKIVMDTIFGKKNFQNEIIWKRSSAHSSSKRWGPIHDVLLLYTKGANFIWNKVYEQYSDTYLDNFYRFHDEKGKYRSGDLTGAGTRTGDSGKPWKGIDPNKVGRHWAVPKEILRDVFQDLDIDRLSTQAKLDLLDQKGLVHWPAKGSMPRFKGYFDESKGVPIQDIISDIPPIGAHAMERLGYPTQKPEALLERIINASSNEGDVVLDPFCGCGTATVAAQKLKRRWIGIDITHLSINLIKWRLKDAFGLEPKRDYRVVGEPEDIQGARELASQNRYQFQWWALSLIQARPYGEKKKGSDTGIDGYLYFSDEKDAYKKAIVSVKSGGASVQHIRDLGHVIEREGSEIGVFLTLEPPTQPMVTEAAGKGFYRSEAWGKDYARIQIITIEELLSGKQPNIPPTLPAHKRAGKVSMGEQGELLK